MSGKRKSRDEPDQGFQQVRLINGPYQFLGAKDTATDTHWHIPGGGTLSRTEIEDRIGPCRLQTVPVAYAQEPVPRGSPQAYSEEETETVKDLVREGRTHAQIAWVIGRTPDSVGEYCRKNKITRKRLA
jgi:DNA-binding CsgD family transcriptional regulator